MPVYNNDSVLMRIAGGVGKGTLHFEMSDRPSVMMGSRSLFIESVGFDMSEGMLTYSVCDSRGKVLSSAFGARRLDELSPKTLDGVCRAVERYAAMRRERGRNLDLITDRVGTLGRRSGRRMGTA